MFSLFFERNSKNTVYDGTSHDRYTQDKNAYLKGQEDFKDGLWIDDCPYDTKREKECWEMGWQYNYYISVR